MGTPQQRYLPRTIASDRVDDAAPSVAQHERTLAHCAAHLVALRMAGEPRVRPSQAGVRFRWNQRIGAAETPPRPP